MLGGYMTWGIPAFRCPPEVFQEDIDRMLARCPGVTVHLGIGLGRDVTLEELKERHDAVLLTIGAWWAKGLRMDNAGDERVVDGVEFLRRVNGGERPELPARVIVVGAGDVAMDACRVAKRLPGCEDVQGALPARARRDPRPQGRALGRDRGGHRVRLQRAAGRGPGENGCARAPLQSAPSSASRARTGAGVPIDVPGSEHDYDCGLVILATGQKAESAHLAELGLMAAEKVRTDWDSMRTEDPKVFAAGDGAFGPSTIVNAMYHGHRAAYYVKALPRGRSSDPLPYRTPYKTRRVPVAQDALWEVFAREHQEFHGLGENPIAFPEIESTYDVEAARSEKRRAATAATPRPARPTTASARARTSSSWRGRCRRTRASSARSSRSGSTVSNEKHFHPEVASLDDIVFLPANLSRLVIDPYRDACRVATELGGGALELASPFLVAGFDDAPDEVREAVAHGVRRTGSPTSDGAAIGDDVPWLQLLADGDEPDPARGGRDPPVAGGGRDPRRAGWRGSADRPATAS